MTKKIWSCSISVTKMKLIFQLMCAVFFTDSINPAFLHKMKAGLMLSCGLPCGSLLAPTRYQTSVAPTVRPLVVSPWVPPTSRCAYSSQLGREVVTWLWAPKVQMAGVQQISAQTWSPYAESTPCPSLGRFFSTLTQLLSFMILTWTCETSRLSQICLQMVRWLKSQEGRAGSWRGWLIPPLQMRN